MGIYWFLIAAPSVLVAIFTKVLWPHEITLKEWGYQLLACLFTTVLCVGFLSIGKYHAMTDFDVLNGVVTKKYSEHVTCEHEHVCGQSCSGSGKNRSCHPVYCKDHAYDVDWNVDTTVGDHTIDRVDRRGLTPPPRWLAIKIGEAASAEESVRSYLMVDEDRFKTSSGVREKYKDVKLPDYPRVYDYYRFNRIVNETLLDVSTIKEYLDDALKVDGKAKQLNITILVTSKDDDYFEIINEHWRGVRKNDTVLVYGVEPDGKIKWFRAMTYGDGQGNQILLSELATLAAGHTLNLELVTKKYALIKGKYERLPAQTFAYLEDTYQPSWWGVLIFLVINLAASIWVSLYMKRNDFA